VRLAVALIVLAVARGAAAQPADAPNGVLLVAKPGIADPRFRETVVLVTQVRDGHTVGVVLNRPLDAPLSSLIPDPAAREYKERVFYGGPVMEGAIVALFRSEAPPAAPAFQVLRGIYLSMHPRAVEPLLQDPAAHAGLRLFAGFSGWAPGQLQAELKRDGWHILSATPEIVFRTDTRRMWQELIDRARGIRTRAGLDARAILAP
jgi:putative transcriptional regulator